MSAPRAHTVTRAGVSHGLVRRAGREAGAAQRAPAGESAPATVHPPLATGLTECDWHATLTLPDPEALPSGVYIVKLHASDGAQSDCLFVVRSARPTPLLVEIPTATYEAYNAWGGDSLYPGGSRRWG